MKIVWIRPNPPEAFQGKAGYVLVKSIPLGAGIARSPMIDKLASDKEMMQTILTSITGDSLTEVCREEREYDH